jgi:hypothetical protein
MHAVTTFLGVSGDDGDCTDGVWCRRMQRSDLGGISGLLDKHGVTCLRIVHGTTWKLYLESSVAFCAVHQVRGGRFAYMGIYRGRFPSAGMFFEAFP